ncbi:interferon-induced protein 44-like isoform X2 [Neoarius graeffei]|nr:interferon-induced protein 44-like isoform X2 [Neoarius graeffei]
MTEILSLFFFFVLHSIIFSLLQQNFMIIYNYFISFSVKIMSKNNNQLILWHIPMQTSRNNIFEASFTEARLMSWNRLINVFRLGRKTPSPNPEPDPEFDRSWRPVAWSEDNKNEMLKSLKDFQPGTAEVSEIKILLHGPIGAGKSSFINSVNTILQGYNTTGALADSSAGQSHSFTQEFKIHRLKKERPGTFYPFTLSDSKGLEPGDSEGTQTKNIKKILKGHVKSGYTLNPVKSTEECDQKPSLKDKVHCLVW